MTGIHRVGQRVQCIEHNFRYLWCPDVASVPEFLGEYTVGGFEDFQDMPGIHLNEFPNTKCECLGNKNLPWPMQCFRPLINDEAENKYVTEIIKKAVKKIKEQA